MAGRVLNDYKLPDPVPLETTVGSLSWVTRKKSTNCGFGGRGGGYLRFWKRTESEFKIIWLENGRFQLVRIWELRAGTGQILEDLKFMVDLNGDGGAVVHSTGLSSDLPSATISAWIRPTSSNFHFSVRIFQTIRNFRSIWKISDRYFACLDESTNSSGTDNETFWSKGYLQLNQWSHLALTYDMNSKRVRFFLDGELDDEMIFAGNLPLPLSSGFRLGPQDGQEASSTIGSIDDFRMYQRALEPLKQNLWRWKWRLL